MTGPGRQNSPLTIRRWRSSLVWNRTRRASKATKNCPNTSASANSIRASPTRSMAASRVMYSTKVTSPKGSRQGWQEAVRSAGCHRNPLLPELASLSMTRAPMSRHWIVASILQPKVTLRQSSASTISYKTSMSRPSNSKWRANQPPAAPCRLLDTDRDGINPLVAMRMSFACDMPLFI